MRNYTQYKLIKTYLTLEGVIDIDIVLGVEGVCVGFLGNVPSVTLFSDMPL